jgi:hypothetical protein
MQHKVSTGIVAIVWLAAVGLTWWAWDQCRQAKRQATAAATAQAEAVTQRDAAQAAQATAVADQKQVEAVATAAADGAQARATEVAAAEQGQAMAEQRYQAALAQKLGAQAQLRLDDTADPALGELLAVESLRRYPSVEGDVAARRGIDLLSWRHIFAAGALGGCTRDMSSSVDGRRVAVLGSNCRYEDRDQV